MPFPTVWPRPQRDTSEGHRSRPGSPPLPPPLLRSPPPPLRWSLHRSRVRRRRAAGGGGAFSPLRPGSRGAEASHQPVPAPHPPFFQARLQSDGRRSPSQGGSVAGRGGLEGTGVWGGVWGPLCSIQCYPQVCLLRAGGMWGPAAGGRVRRVCRLSGAGGQTPSRSHTGLSCFLPCPSQGPPPPASWGPLMSPRPPAPRRLKEPRRPACSSAPRSWGS